MGLANPNEGAPTYYLAKFCQKFYENKENLTEVGARPKILLCRSATTEDI